MILTNLKLYVMPLVIGVVVFFILTGGASLNPIDFSWMHGDDPALHYLGWSFFRRSEWGWPIGINPKYGLEISSSIIFSDSIPLIAIPLKIFDKFLPGDFQYLGIWVLVSIVLQSMFAWLLLGLITDDFKIKCISIANIINSP